MNQEDKRGLIVVIVLGTIMIVALLNFVRPWESYDQWHARQMKKLNEERQERFRKYHESHGH